MTEINSILYATDLGKHTRPAFRMAVSLSKLNSARIHFLYVIEPVSANTASLVNTYLPEGTIEELHQRSIDDLHIKIKNRIDEFCVEELNGNDFPGGEPIVDIIEGAPAATIITMAKDKKIDLIVMGSHAHSALDNLFIGSVADKVVNRSSTPVLLVPLKSD